MIDVGTVIATMPRGENNLYIPELGISMRELVCRHQIHRCGAYCLADGQCRFGYAKPVEIGPTGLNEAGTRVVYHRPEDEDRRVNTYNPELLRALQSNMDLQLNVGAAAKYYIVKYTTKGSPVLTGYLETTMDGGTERVAVRYNQCGLMEMIYDILGFHLYSCTTPSIFFAD